MRVLAAIAVLALAATTARADDVAVVVTGDTALKPKIAGHLQRWLSKHGHGLAESALDADAIDTIANCFVVNDPGCARGVVEARAKAASVIYAHVEVKKQNVTMTTYWFVKGHDAIGERRSCERCAEDAWRGMADTMMDVLATGSAGQGRLELRSKPACMVVLVDNAQVGVTPLDREVAAGRHSITLMHRGRQVGEKTVEVASGDSLRVMIKADLSAEHDDEGGHSRLGPLLVIIGGGALVGTGAGFIYIGERNSASNKYIFPDSTPVGIGITALGVGAVVGGAIWMWQSGGTSAPTVALSPGGASVGWLTRF